MVPGVRPPDRPVPRVLGTGHVRRPETIADELIRRIADGRLCQGDRMTERRLMDEFAASRAVIREAVAKLEALGVVEQRQGVGTTVLGATDSYAFLGASAPAHLTELRIAIESEAAGMAAVRRTDDDLQRLERALRSESLRDSAVRHQPFHLAVALATHNRHYARLLWTLACLQSSALLPRQADTVGGQRLQVEQQAEIVRAIRAGDTAAAAAGMRVHLLLALRAG